MEQDNDKELARQTPMASPAFALRVAGLEAIVNAWAAKFDLEKLASGLAHVSITEKRTEQIFAFAKMVFLEGLYSKVSLRETSNPSQISAKTFEGLADTLLAPITIKRDQHGFFYHPALPDCDEDVHIDKLLGAFGLETTFVDLDSDPLSATAKDKMYDVFDFSNWTPVRPNGDGWMLLQIQETENGVYAMFARRATTPLRRPLHSARMKAEGQHSGAA